MRPRSSVGACQMWLQMRRGLRVGSMRRSPAQICATTSKHCKEVRSNDPTSAARGTRPSGRADRRAGRLRRATEQPHELRLHHVVHHVAAHDELVVEGTADLHEVVGGDLLSAPRDDADAAGAVEHAEGSVRVPFGRGPDARVLYEPGEHDLLAVVVRRILEELTRRHHVPRLLTHQSEPQRHRRGDGGGTQYRGPSHGISQGTAGHASGAVVLGCATNRPARSLAAVDGGWPLAFAGASAHHGRPLPSVRRTAIRPCEGSSRVNPQPAPPPASETRFAGTATRETGALPFTYRER